MGSLQAAKDIYVELQSLKSSQAYARGQGGGVLSSINGTCIYVGEVDLSSKQPQNSADHTGVHLKGWLTAAPAAVGNLQPPSHPTVQAVLLLFSEMYCTSMTDTAMHFD